MWEIFLEKGPYLGNMPHFAQKWLPKKTSIEHLASVLELVHFCIDIHILFPTKKRKGGGEGQPKNNEKKSWKIFSTKLLLSPRKRKINSFTSFFQLTVIVSASPGILFSASQSQFQTLQQNASGYESIEHQLKMHVNTLPGDLGESRKNISGNALLLFYSFSIKKACQRKPRDAGLFFLMFCKMHPSFTLL